ncbi:MAG: response regulator, partial [Myxococcota bacterium]
VVAGAAGVAEALPLVPSFEPNVLVSDIGMAGQDGYGLIRQLRQSGLSAHELPAVALTAFARVEDRQDALRAGYQVHLAKPVDPPQLVNAVVAALRLR